MNRLEIDRATAYYDENTAIVHVAYRGVLDGVTPIQVYTWLDELYKTVDPASLHGQIFDFREVTEFDQGNITAARRTSSRMNMKTNVSKCPVALLVNDPYQEEVLHTGMRVSPEHQRKRVVWSEEEALSFFDEFKREHGEEAQPE